jgi:hypothetical protein
MKKLLWLAAALAMGLWFSSALSAADIALGVSQLSSRNPAISQAGKYAQAQILLQKAADLLSPEEMSQLWPRLSEELFSQQAAYINNFKILAIHQAQSQTWVLVEVEVNKSALEQAAAALKLARPAKPPVEQILCLISEDVSPDRPPVYWWAGSETIAACPQAVKDGLRQIGYSALEAAALTGISSGAIKDKPVLTEEQAYQLGSKAGAGLILWGRIRSYPVLSDKPIIATPLIQLALLDVAQTRMLAQVEVEGGVFSGSLPAEFAASMDREVEEALSKLFELAGRIAAAPRRQVIVEMEGLRSIADLTQMERMLARLRLDGQVTQVRRESISRGKATLLLDCNIDGMALAERLETMESANWSIKILEKSPTLLRVAPFGRVN